MANTIIIVAGGIGSRFGGDLPKQFLHLGNKPILIHSLEMFHQFDPTLEIIVVLPSHQMSYWDELCKEHQVDISHKVVAGGSERFYSVKAGLAVMALEGVVGIHDAVRPLVSKDTIIEAFKTALHEGTAVPVVTPADSIREIKGDSSVPVNRDVIRIVQTPQCFRKDIILKAFDVMYSEQFTDDASVVERSGHEIFLTRGNKENIKITNAEDYALAQAYYNYLNPATAQ